MHHDTHSFIAVIEEIIEKINKWFQLNSLKLNLDKTKFTQFSTKINIRTPICIDYEKYHIDNLQSTSFLGLILDKTSH